MRVSIRVLLALVALLLCAATVQGALGSRAARRDLRAEQAPEELIKLTKRGVFKPLPPRPTPQKQALKDLPNGYSPLMAFSQPPTNAPKGLFEAQWDVIEYHSSGGYDTEMEGVINNARLYASMMPAPTNRSAWVFDIDETTLSGYEFMKSIGFGYIAKINHEWVQTSSAPAIPQAFAFYQQLLKQGFKIIFLTGRKDDEHDATELNLHKQGYTTYEMLITRTPAEYNLTASVFKNARRTQFVEELGYDIVGCVGDQFSDMAGPYTGFKVKLPNAIYFLP